jgi:hypothetical protein
MYVSGKAGESIVLDASDSRDPDGDALTFHWWRYPEADSYSGKVEIQDSTASKITLKVPEDLGNQVIHIVLSVEDKGTPPLVRYKRIVLKGM